jgi:ribosomal protein S18 acetylase RimI-like enzyme
MVFYRLLSASDLIPLYDCFLEAFSDYEVDMQMSREQFEQRIARDGVRLEISAGAFDDEKMIGFYMNAAGSWQGKQTAYDAGTGVIPEYRGRGVAKELFAFVVERLREVSISQYLLEVLTSNAGAVSLYRKLGFVETRVLAVFRSSEPVTALGELPGVSIRPVEEPDWKLFESFWDGYPSWQNSSDAVERVANQRQILGAYVEGKCIGYGVVFRPSGNLMQLAVAHEFRRRGIGSRILSSLSTSEALKVNNIDEKLTGTLAFFEANRFKIDLKQYEMVKDL